MIDSIDTRWIYRSRRWTELSRRMRRRASKCEACGAVDRPLEVDHIVSPKLGGAPFDVANLQVLCRDCNRSKGMGSQLPVTDQSFAESSLRSLSPGGYPGVIFETPDDDTLAALRDELEGDTR